MGIARLNLSHYKLSTASAASPARMSLSVAHLLWSYTIPACIHLFPSHYKLSSQRLELRARHRQIRLRALLPKQEASNRERQPTSPVPGRSAAHSHPIPMASGQQPAVQTFVLRVTIHCHGCKKKVRKVLKSIQGVQDVKVDAQLHKVMVTGTVDAQTLVKRLHKSGKQALPWQHTPASNPEAAPPTEAPAAAPAEDGSKDAAVADKKPAEPVKEPQADSWDKKPEQETAPDPEKKPEAEKEAESEKKKAEKEEAEPSDESKKDGGEGEGEPKANCTEPKANAAAKEAGNDESEAKKKQSKPKDAAAVDRSLSPAPAYVLRHAHQEFNPYNAPQPVMSYNMAQPRPSVSYYAPQPEQGYSQQQAGYSSMMQMQQQHQPPPAQQAYSQAQQAQPMQQWSPSYLYMPYPHASPESYYQDLYSPPGTLQDSYRLFDDENPNSCSVM